ncbi:MAG TPA: hypothetical protein VM327_03955 [Candidatus Thermoplasmatota archaeon]|nr:hypothetical protein [Candidatus Thermoplasmatota archaeon]
MAFKQDGSASAQVISLVVAAAVFLAAVGSLLLVSRGSGKDSSTADAAAKDIEASSLADLIIGSPGIGWSLGADQVTRLGLAATNGSGIQPSSIQALKGAMATSAANSKVDYPDAQRSLDMDPASSQQFHIRMYPVGMDTVYNASLSGLRVAYIADFNGFPGVTVPATTLPTQYVPVANTMLNVSMPAATALERQAIRDLGVDFTDQIFMVDGSPNVKLARLAQPDISLPVAMGVTAIDGDVYADDKNYLDATLPGRLNGYDLLIVGSGVAHSTMTSNAVKDGIRDWVLAGGMLVVLGSGGMAYQWLQPLFSTGIATVNGAAMAPDVSHPLLKEPNVLSWTSYDSHGRGWDIKDQGSGAHYNDFSHVIVQGGEDVLAISNDGAFGAGRILLTTYLPREIAQTMGVGEAMAFIENIVLYADRTNLYLEYGPPAPLGEPVSVAVRQSWVWDPVLGQVPVRFEIQTWG